MKIPNYTKNMEPQAKAPKKLKQQTFQKIEQINLIKELLGFYASIPISFFDGSADV